MKRQYLETLTTLSSHYAEWDASGVLQYESWNPQSYISQSWCIDRTWDVSSKRPYRSTLEYQCDRFRFWLGQFKFDEVATPYWYGTHTLREGYVLPTKPEVVKLFRYDPAVQTEMVRITNEARNACFDLIPDSVWNVPVFLGELRETSEFVYSVAKGIDQTSRSLVSALTTQKGRKAALHSFQKGVKQLLNGRGAPPATTSDVASLWLAWRYSVLAGLSDVEAAAKTTASLLLDKSYQDDRVIMTNRSFALDLGDLTVGDSSWGRGIGLGMSLGEEITHVLSRYCHGQARAWMRVRKTNSLLANANQLGLLNIPAALYQLTTLSFVADWFLDIASYLERWSAALGFEIVDAGWGEKFRFVGSHSVNVGTRFSQVSRELNYPGTAYECTLYSRIPWENPTPIWTPAIRLNLNRFYDAAALVRQIPLRGFKVL